MSYLPGNVCAITSGLYPRRISPDQGLRTPTRNGFTLLELLTTIAVICILTAVAIPSFVSLIRNNRLTSETNALLGLLALGRSEAVKRSRQMILCKSGDGAACSSTPEIHWDKGIILFADANADRILDTSEIIVRSESPFSAADEISFSAGNAMIYRADGTSSGGTFTIKSGNLQKKVIVSLAGRARTE